MRDTIIIIIIMLMGAYGITTLDLEQEEITFGASLDMAVNIDDLQTRIDDEQADWILTHDRHKYIPKTTDPSTGIPYSVTEYYTLRDEKDEIGYQSIFYDNLWRKVTSTGTGLETANRTYVVDFPIIIPTST